jgi:hypothetical protein
MERRGVVWDREGEEGMRVMHAEERDGKGRNGREGRRR